MILDKIGQEIKVGDIIVYGHALGRCAGLQLGKVLAAKTIDKTYKYSYRITVQGINSGWNKVTKTWDSLVLLKKGTLQYPDRIIVLDKTKLPKNVLEILGE